MMFKFFKIMRILLPVILLPAVLCGCGSPFFSTDMNERHVKMPVPKLNVVVMPKQRLDLSGYKALMVPVFMAGAQEHQWGSSVTGMIRSLLLQEGLFNTLALFPTNHPDDREIRKQARDRGFDYLIEVSIPPVIEPSGDSEGWVALSMKIIDVDKGYSVWRVYGEAQLIPQPTFHCLLGKKPFVQAPSVGQGIVSITRQMAHVMRQ